MKDPTQLGPDELKAWLRDHLQMRGSAATAINVRHDESPFEKPAALWKAGDESFRERLLLAVRDFLQESARGEWNPEAFHQLGFLIEACPLPRTEAALEDLVQGQRLLQLKAGAQLHMLALRNLLALGWKGTPAFWKSQHPLIGDRWPSIIFEGLAYHDLDLAFDALPGLARDPQSMREIFNLFPGLMRTAQVSFQELASQSGRIINRLEAEPAGLLREWFSLRGIELRTDTDEHAHSGEPYASSLHQGRMQPIADALAEDSQKSAFWISSAVLEETKPPSGEVMEARYTVSITGGLLRIAHSFQGHTDAVVVPAPDLRKLRDALNQLIEMQEPRSGPTC